MHCLSLDFGCFSLLPLSLSFAFSDRMEALLDVLAGSRRVALLAAEVEQARRRILCHLRLDTLATQAAHVLLDVAPVEAVDHGALVAPLQQHVPLGTLVALDVHLRLEEVQHVVGVSVELLAEHVEVDNRGLNRDELGLRQLSLHI